MQERAGYLFVVPAVVLYLTFVLAPVILTVVLSFAYYDPQLGSHWVGLANFHRFFTDPRSMRIFWNTLRFTLFAVTGNVSVGLLLALALNRVDAALAALLLPAGLLPAGDHRGGVCRDRVGLFLLGQRHLQLLPHPRRARPLSIG